MKKTILSAVILFVPFFILFTGVSGAAPLKKIVVGGKSFTEHHILTRMLTLTLKAGGYDVEERIGMTSRVIRDELLAKNIDIYWEYTGTGYKAILRQTDEDIATDPARIYDTVKKLDQKNGVVWLKKAPFNNTFALAMRKEKADTYQVHTLSDLANRLNQKKKTTFGIMEPFYRRPDGFKKLASHYGFTVPQNFITFLARETVYTGLEMGKIDVGVGYATDARMIQYNLVALEDDRHFFPVYNPAPVLLEETLKQNPKIGEIANRIGPLLDTPTITNLNYQVDIEKKEVGEVAETWLKEVGLLP